MIIDEIQPALVTMNQAAKYLALSRRTIERMVERGELRSKHIGKRHLVVFVDIKALAT